MTRSALWRWIFGAESVVCHTPLVSSATMQSAAHDSVGYIARHRFGDAFNCGAGLTEPGRAFLVGKLGNDGDLGRARDPLSVAELGDIDDPKRRQELRAWFESAFALGWDRAMLRSRELGDLAPAARLVPDGRFSPRSLDQRVRAALERAGYSRWSEVLDVTVGGLFRMPGLGPTTVVSTLAACFERSLIGLSTGVESHDGSDLAVLLTEERRGPKQPVLESLLDAVATHPESPNANSCSVEAARCLLISSAPWSLEHASALSGLLSGITDDQDRSIFIRTELHPERRSLTELAEELGISSSHVAQRHAIVRRFRFERSWPQHLHLSDGSWIAFHAPSDERRRQRRSRSRYAASALTRQLGQRR